jgi:hypothetical protein
MPLLNYKPPEPHNIFVDTTTGAHFEYIDLYNRLSALHYERNIHYNPRSSCKSTQSTLILKKHRISQCQIKPVRNIRSITINLDPPKTTQSRRAPVARHTLVINCSTTKNQKFNFHTFDNRKFIISPPNNLPKLHNTDKTLPCWSSMKLKTYSITFERRAGSNIPIHLKNRKYKAA